MFTTRMAEDLKKYGGEEMIETEHGDNVYIRFENDEFVAETMGYSPSEIKTKDYKEIKDYFGI